MEVAGVSLFGVGVLFLIALAVLWFLLPFALFGTKPLLRDLLSETRRTNALLDELRKHRIPD
jgi:hypothetical protein